MQLNVKHRLVLLSLLPADGQDIQHLRIIRDLQDDLGFSEAELAEFGIRTVGEGRLEWKPEADRLVDIDIGPRAFVLIQERLQALNTDKQLTMDHLELWDLFDCDNE